MDNFPDYCLRGIFGRDDITDEGSVSAICFFPKLDSADRRDDGKSETSIDWEDDCEALPACMNRYPRGVARLPREHIDTINGWPNIEGILGYERQPIPSTDDSPGNPRHGNILYPADFMRYSKTHRIMVAGVIALRADWIQHPT